MNDPSWSKRWMEMERVMSQGFSRREKKCLEKLTVSRNHVSGFTSACFHIIMLAQKNKQADQLFVLHVKSHGFNQTLRYFGANSSFG